MSRRLFSVPLAGALLLPAAWLPLQPPLACRTHADPRAARSCNSGAFDAPEHHYRYGHSLPLAVALLDRIEPADEPDGVCDDAAEARESSVADPSADEFGYEVVEVAEYPAVESAVTTGRSETGVLTDTDSSLPASVVYVDDYPVSTDDLSGNDQAMALNEADAEIVGPVAPVSPDVEASAAQSTDVSVPEAAAQETQRSESDAYRSDDAAANYEYEGCNCPICTATRQQAATAADVTRDVADAQAEAVVATSPVAVAAGDVTLGFDGAEAAEGESNGCNCSCCDGQCTCESCGCGNEEAAEQPEAQAEQGETEREPSESLGQCSCCRGGSEFASCSCGESCENCGCETGERSQAAIEDEASASSFEGPALGVPTENKPQADDAGVTPESLPSDSSDEVGTPTDAAEPTVQETSVLRETLGQSWADLQRALVALRPLWVEGLRIAPADVYWTSLGLSHLISELPQAGSDPAAADDTYRLARPIWAQLRGF